MAMPAVLPSRWTADAVRALPDEPGQRFECVDGELLVSPSPRLTHQSVVMLLWRALVEVLSPSTARFDRVVKRRRYQRAGVEYWIVDLDARLVERWLPDAERPTIHTESITWQPGEATATLTIELTPLFVEALGEP
jgi:Uma2 family endonuclease